MRRRQIQPAILKAILGGKTPEEICAEINVTKQHVYSTRRRLRMAGKIVPVAHSFLTPRQERILRYYSENIPVPMIAKALRISCQTVQNHASSGFERLGFNSVGTDRIEQLCKYFASLEPGGTPSGEHHALLAPKPVKQFRDVPENLPITMDDPFFN